MRKRGVVCSSLFYISAAAELGRRWSLQHSLPPELANNVTKLYRECLRRAKFIGHKQHNTELLVETVRQQFRRNMHETNPEKSRN